MKYGKFLYPKIDIENKVCLPHPVGQPSRLSTAIHHYGQARRLSYCVGRVKVYFGVIKKALDIKN
ncbi:MAG: hypothetical protein Q7J27_15255 [Syntrophales bacterium]|nr:hypothetical protein [Syntrophales bacterium]